ncbi:MAG: hypothetical protein HY980_02220 [Candidatus Magasanikbacteria bacterium]|nr:hypothetical protein [Candidatus Magasanikbacteria bacterium]
MAEATAANDGATVPPQETSLHMAIPLPPTTPGTTLDAMAARGAHIEVRDGELVEVKTLVPEGGTNPFVPQPPDAPAAAPAKGGK